MLRQGEEKEELSVNRGARPFGNSHIYDAQKMKIVRIITGCWTFPERARRGGRKE